MLARSAGRTSRTLSRRGLWILVVALTVPLFLTASAPRSTSAAGALPDSTLVPLRSGPVVVSSASTQQFLDALARDSGGGLHGIVVLRRHPTPSDRSALQARGLLVQHLVHGRAYRARVAPSFARNDSLVSSLLDGIAQLTPRDRVAPEIWNADYRRYVVRAPNRDSISTILEAGGALRLTVAFHEDVAEANAERLLAGLAVRHQLRGPHEWYAVVTQPNVRRLAAADLVRWISGPTSFSTMDNDVTRGEVAVETVQDFSVVDGEPLGLGGMGIQVGVFDEGIDEKHDDFQTWYAGVAVDNRVKVQSLEASWHGTMSAGIIAGNGKNSDGVDSWGVSNGTSPYRWRGMAPKADLLEVHLSSVATFNVGTGLWELDRVKTAAVVRDQIVNHGMDVSNHPYPLDDLGEYDKQNAQRDSMVRGDALDGTQPIPARLQVFSAGNLGGVDGSELPLVGATIANSGYFSLNKQLKNAIVVGSWRPVSARVSTTSSLGPTSDGRIKPDLVAPASPVTSTGYWKAGGTLGQCPPSGVAGWPTRQQFYATDCGTSFAAPVISGILALVLEQYRATFAVDPDVNPPLPSTLRGILIHTAVDKRTFADPFPNKDGTVQAFDGPDFATGWGMVNAAAAVDVTARKLFIEDEIAAECEVKTFSFPIVQEILGTNPDVRVTLAWDDIAASPELATSAILLRNDLDLVLIEPNGTRHYPWLRNQVVKDLAGTPLTPDQQTCGTTVLVDRLLDPNAAFTDAQLTNASTGNGPDHLNNVEQVFVAAATPGQWKAVVTGFKLEPGIQKFSLIGLSRHFYGGIEPHRVCKTWPFFCKPLLFNLCKKYPGLCERPQIIPLFPWGPRVSFRNPSDRAILPLNQMCPRLAPPSACDASVPGVGYELSIGPTPVPLGISLYTSDGRRVAGSDVPVRSARFTFRPDRTNVHFLVFSPSARTQMGATYDVPVRVRQLPR